MNPVPTAAFLDGSLQGHITGNTPTLSLEQVAQLSGVGFADLKGLVDYGVLAPVESACDPWAFAQDCVMTLQRADHLRRDLALDEHGFALAMMLLSQITNLEGELRHSRPPLRALPAEDQLEGRAN